MRPHVRWGLVVGLLIGGRGLRAQGWDAPPARALAERATARRAGLAGGPALAAWRARAHGFVFFLAQVGEGLAGPPRLVRADELDDEVYWQAPGPGKQVVRGWRTRSWLPADVHYHRDHLGIVTDGFGDRIRIGEGDEVRGVVHPLSAEGLGRYAFALTDSLQLVSGGRTLVVDVLSVRPTDPAMPAVVGTLFIDRATAEVVRFVFSFTPAAYLDAELEDITVSLENALVDGKAWLPFRQEIELRRRSSWFDFPARGIIRGRWEIGDYDLTWTPTPGALAGPAIGGLLAPGDSARPWGRPLADLVGPELAPVTRQDLVAVRRDLARVATGAVLSRLRTAQLHAPRVSDLIRFDRVEGVALGAGIGLRPSARFTVTPRAGVGLATGRVTGGIALALHGSGATIALAASRTVRDFSDLPVVSPTLNSLTAQEGGKDYGDYLLLDRADIALTVPVSRRGSIAMSLARERSQSLDVAAHPANGTSRPNPAFGGPAETVGRVTLARADAPGLPGADLGGAVSVEGGAGSARYLRVTMDLEGRWPLGSTSVAARGFGGFGTAELPAWRGFALGGRGTLVGEPFRAWGGRRAAFAEAEWRVGVPVPAIPLGSFASTGDRMTVAPFVAAGWADGALGGMPWRPSPGVRPVAGLAAEWLLGLLRVEAGWSLRTGSFGVTVDVSRSWWGVL